MSGVVAAGDRSTAAAAAEILRTGGNAVDAAVAGAFAAFVAEPLLASAGGAGMMTVCTAEGAAFVVDFFSPVPGLGGRPATLDFREIVIDFGSATQAFHVGRGSVAPPMALQGLALAADKGGRLSLDELVRPAVERARRGVAMSTESSHVFELLWSIQEVSDGPVRFAGGGAPKPGQVLKNPELADLLEELVTAHGSTPPSFRRAMLDQFGASAGGLLSEADLDSAKPRIVEARAFALGDATVLTSPRIGGALIERILTELAERQARTPYTVALACRAGHEARKAELAAANGRGSTTHISVLDEDGGAASVTLTNGEGCGYLAEGSGVQLNNFLGEEDLNPKGFHHHAPGAQLPTMVAPTIALKNGRPIVALGSGGSNRIRSVVSQVLDRVFRGEAIEPAVLAPRVHAETDDVWIELEGRTAVERVSILTALGDSFKRVHPFDSRAFFFGGVHAASRNDAGEPSGAGDPRRGGAVVIV